MGTLQAEVANKENSNLQNTVKESTVCKNPKSSCNDGDGGHGDNARREVQPPNQFLHPPREEDDDDDDEEDWEEKANLKDEDEEDDDDANRDADADDEAEPQEDLEEDTVATSSNTSTAETNTSPLEPPISSASLVPDTEATDIPAEGMSEEAPGVASTPLPSESCPRTGPAPSTVHVENAVAVQVGIGNVLSLAQTDESETPRLHLAVKHAGHIGAATVAVYINNCGTVQVGNHNRMVVEKVAPKVTPQENEFVKTCIKLGINPKQKEDIFERLGHEETRQRFAAMMAEKCNVRCKLKNAGEGCILLELEVPTEADRLQLLRMARDGTFQQVLLETFLPEFAAEGRAVNMNLAIGIRNPSQDMLDELQGAVASNSHDNVKVIEIPNGAGPDTAAAAVSEQPRRDSPGSDSPGTNYYPSPPDCPMPVCLPQRNSPGSDSPGRNSPGSDSPGRNSPGRNSPGRNSPGRNSPGRDSPGRNSPGRNSPGRNSPGRNSPGRDSPGRNSPRFSTNTHSSNTDDIYKLTSLLRLLSEPGDAEDETRQEETTVSAEGLVGDMPIEESNANIQASEDNNDQRLETDSQPLETDDQSLETDVQPLETNDQRLDTDLQRPEPIEEQSYDLSSGFVSLKLDEAARPGLSAHPEVPSDVTSSKVFERSRSQETDDEETTKLLRRLAVTLDRREWKQVAQALRVPQPEKDLSAADTGLRMRILRDWQTGPAYGQQFDRLLLALQECGRDDFAVELLQSAPQTIYTTSSGPPTRGVAETPSVVPTQVKETARQPKKSRKPPVDPRTPLRRMPYQLMKKIAMELDPLGPLANWKDLADCAGYSMQEIGPTRALLQAWGTRNATVQDLLNALRQTELLNVAEMLAPDDSDDEDV
ncbi:PREDICTED: LOW QUALITY PROTEIN: uncharacterized protein LOC109477112 [Branchiostoma belcheri]|uniref:LOW QUALITY PROTEIN: uncharacterized protein LOC109477112 n=1 Tax=Branchiostoma belcheri TaxID=7741 RepID=A0A6P4ZAS5_BRABE|nr:PREDICTED: LOW QUALITY PROTEIN: uncharacterized protein LOC109477112 [Branchiostoma belcheri]